MKFPKSCRLLNRRGFRSVISKGQRYIGRTVIIDYHTRDKSNAKLGIAASKRFGNACKRNRFKRITREAFRKLLPQMPRGLTLVVRPRKSALSADSCQIAEEMVSFLHDCLDKPKSRTTKSGENN